MTRSPIALTRPAQGLPKLMRRLQALYLARSGLITKLLAIVAFFSIGVV